MRLGTFSTSLLVSLAAILIAIVVTAAQLPKLATAVLTPHPGDDPTRARLAKYLDDHGADVDLYRDRLEGRSLFFKPRPPRRPPKVVDREPTPQPEPEPRPDPKPVRPASYPGPTVLFVLGQEVWFHGGLKLRVGEEGNGVTVLETNPPWNVKVEYDGWDWDLPLFERFDLPAAPTAKRPVKGLDVDNEKPYVVAERKAGEAAGEQQGTRQTP